MTLDEYIEHTIPNKLLPLISSKMLMYESAFLEDFKIVDNYSNLDIQSNLNELFKTGEDTIFLIKVTFDEDVTVFTYIYKLLDYSSYSIYSKETSFEFLKYMEANNKYSYFSFSMMENYFKYKNINLLIDKI